MITYELLVALDRKPGVRQTAGRAWLATASGSQVAGAEQPSGFRFPLAASGNYDLSYEPTPGVIYGWRLTIVVAPGALLVTVGTSTASTYVTYAVVSIPATALILCQTTLHADLSEYWVSRAREVVGMVRNQRAPNYAVMNRRITAAYARTYLSNPDVFKWAGMAAFASRAIGDGIRDAERLANGQFIGRAVSNGPTMSPIPPVMPIIDSIVPDGLLIRRLLGEGNMLLFAGIYWQHLAYGERGLRMLEYEHGERRLTDEELRIWRLIDQGASQRNVATIWLGNHDLLQYEQTQVLQRGVYDQNRDVFRRLSSPPISWVAPFRSPIPPHTSMFPGSDLGDSGQRWGWIESTMLPEWRRLEANRAQTTNLLRALEVP